MNFPKSGVYLALASLLFVGSAWSQERSEREIAIHENIKLIEMSVAPEIPEDILQQYRGFLPILIESLKENTTAQSEDCALTLRVSAAIREVGSAKTKRPMAKISAFRRNSKREYLANFILYSYVNSGPVTKEETSQFLKKQILEPAACSDAK